MVRRSFRTEHPSFIRFTDEDRNILEEHELTASGTGTEQQSSANTTRMACGVWKKVPRVYRNLLRKGRLHVLVTSANRPEGLVAGKLLKRDLLDTGKLLCTIKIEGKERVCL